jgi:hypothetical protein
MKQFRRTRTEATREGVKKAKNIIKLGLIKHIHPLIAGCDPENCSGGGVMPVCLYVYMFVCLYVCMFVCLYVCMFVCLYACMPVPYTVTPSHYHYHYHSHTHTHTHTYTYTHFCSVSVVEKNEYVRMLQTFRPAQTVFETGIGTGMTVCVCVCVCVCVSVCVCVCVFETGIGTGMLLNPPHVCYTCVLNPLICTVFMSSRRELAQMYVL